MHHVDIVIPIYNAYEDLVKCLDSVYRHTDLKNNRLVLVNDNSSDERIKDYLDGKKADNVIVIHNQSNKGFSHNVNLGMAQSETNDVLLLNSDTIVTGGWIEKMEMCAYSDQSIGTVTPLSNNATLCSVPNFCEENSLPEYLSVDEAAEIVEKVSLHKYPYITVAHGFCMLIKREVINVIGNFDEETFEKGYGEENDFCNRAGQAGYRHVMCDDTYILHTGTKSFISNEKAKLIEEHDRILRKRYSSQMHDNDVYVRDNPDREISQNVGVFFSLANGKKNILYLVQSDFRSDAEDNVGGTQLHVKNLTELMKQDLNVFVAARDREYLNLTLYVDDKIHSWRFELGEKAKYYTFYDRRLREIWECIIDTLKIDIVHIHHLLKTSFDLIDVAKSKKVPVIFTLHDFFMVCPSEKLLNEYYEYVTIDEEDENTWKHYLSEFKDIYEGIDYINIWRKNALDALRKCDRLIVPNKTAREIFVSYYPEIADKFLVQPHGYEFVKVDTSDRECSKSVCSQIENIVNEGQWSKIRGWAFCEGEADIPHKVYVEISSDNDKVLVPSSISWRDDVHETFGKGWTGFEALIPEKFIGRTISVQTFVLTADGKLLGNEETKTITPINKSHKMNDKLNVAFIGGINIEKGGDIIYDVVTSNGNKANWYVFGDIGARKLRGLNDGSICKFGRYNTEDLSTLLDIHKIDVVCILSIWPETYSYTLSEALLCDKMVVVTDIGALGERVRAFTPECCISVNNAVNDISDLIDKLSHDKNMIEQIKVRQKNIEVLSIDEMTARYKSIYDECDSNKKELGEADYKFLANNFRDSSCVTCHGYDGIRQEVKRRIKQYIKNLPSKVVHKIKKIFK